MRSLLITQCLQNDFLAPLGRLDPLPSPLHVGWSESLRLLGEDPSRGPMATLLRACLEDSDLSMIHVRDWHDLSDPDQRAEMELFGAHCVEGTPGSEFVAGLHDELTRHPRSHMVDSTSLNDTLEGNLSGLVKQLSGPETRIGVVGVWTDVKIHYLLYELKTRFQRHNLAVCSALVASRQRRRHFEALEHFKGVLRVQVIDSVSEFLEWMGAPSPAREQLSHPEPPAPEVDCPDLEPGHPYRHLIKLLFRDCRKVELTPLGGGFSGARVYRSLSQDALGYRQAPFVVKLDRRDKIATERVRFEQVENILGSNAPQVREVVDLGEVSGLKYTYATMGVRPVSTLKSWLESLPPGPEHDARAAAVLDEVLENVLSRLYGHRTSERFRFYEYYSFLPRYAASTLERARTVYGEELGSPLCLGGQQVPDPTPFYRAVQEGRLLDPERESTASWIHGDLNYANILLDQNSNYWVIDFFHTAYGHAVQDLAKLENDLKFILTPLHTPQDLERAVAVEASLARGGGLIEGREGLLLAVLRRWVNRLLEGNEPASYEIALLRYAAHTLSFDESSLLQKKRALASVGFLSHKLASQQGISAR